MIINKAVIISIYILIGIYLLYRLLFKKDRFQQEYNNRFRNETLETMDYRFGTVNPQEIVIFQKEVKKIDDWKNLKGFDGYKTFLGYFGITISKNALKNKLYDAFKRSTKLKYHDFIVKKNWGIYKNSKSGYRHRKKY